MKPTGPLITKWGAPRWDQAVFHLLHRPREAPQQLGSNVRFWLKADIGGLCHDVRFPPKSGHNFSRAQCPLLGV